MKKLLLLTAVGTLLATPAAAVQKCVALDPNESGDDVDASLSTVDWSVIFPSKTIRGIGICSSVEGTYTDIYEKQWFDYPDKPEKNTYCYCKMYYPAVSQWVYLTCFNDASSCIQDCGTRCALNVMQYSDFRDMMFSSISN